MSEVKFTKGEWIARRDKHSCLDAFEVVSNIDDDGDYSLIADNIYNKSDAHLISAGTKMYDAIIHVLEMQLRGFIVLGDEATKKLQEALAKARG